MVDPFPSRPVVAKVDAYIPLATPPRALNPPPYTGQGLGQSYSHPHDEEAATGDPFIANKPMAYTGDPFTQRYVPPHYVQNCVDTQERIDNESRCMSRFLVGLSCVVLLLVTVALVVRLTRQN